MQEKNGLRTERREPKVSPEAIRQINRRTSAAVPADAIGAFEFGDYPAPPPDRVDQDRVDQDRVDQDGRPPAG